MWVPGTSLFTSVELESYHRGYSSKAYNVQCRSETGSVIIDLREKERDRETNYVTNQSECRAPAYSRALNLSRIIEVIRQRPTCIMSSVMTRASPLMSHHCIVSGTWSGFRCVLSHEPATIILSPLVPGDRTSLTPTRVGGETSSVIIDLREKERDRQTNYVTNQELFYTGNWGLFWGALRGL